MGETSPSLIGSVVGTLSVLYCFFLLSICIVPLATGLIVPEEKLKSYGYDTDGVLEYVQIYLAAGSIVFFLYLLLGLTRPSRSALNDTGHTSAFVRVGGFVFGMGSMAYLTLRLIEDFYNPVCSTTTLKLGRFLSLTVTVLQMSAVILCSRIKLDQGWGAPHFGCMHLVATNLVTWVMTVYKESEHVMHLAADIHDCVHINEVHRTSNNGTSNNVHNDGHHITKRATGGGSGCTPLSLDFEEIFYPFQIEFVLIGAIAFVSTWRAIAKLEDAEGETGLVKPRPLLYLAGLDFGSSRIGIFAAAPIILGSLATTIYLRLRPKDEQECDHETREVTKKIQYSILDLAGVVAICFGLFKIRKLSWNHNSHSHTLDIVLLRFGLFFNYIFAVFSCAISIFPSPTCENNWLHLVYALASVLYCSFNVLFIELLLHKTVDKERVQHGRQVVTFLILLNLVVWGAFTFGLQNPTTTIQELRYYGRVAGSDPHRPYIWIAIQRIIIPIIIFFRFHSLVMLVECWKNTYRREEAKRFETTIRRGQDVGGWRSIVRRNPDDNNGQ